MRQNTISQRLKFLIKKLATSSRAFSDAIGASPTNTHNYTGPRQVEPKHDYLAKVVIHFRNVNAHWLLTGEGEPFIGDAPSPPVSITDKSEGPVQNDASNNTITHNSILDECRKELQAAHENIKLLTSQLAEKEHLIQSLQKSAT